MRGLLLDSVLSILSGLVFHMHLSHKDQKRRSSSMDKLKEPLTRPAPAGENAVAVHPLPLGEGRPHSAVCAGSGITDSVLRLSSTGMAEEAGSR